MPPSVRVSWPCWLYVRLVERIDANDGAGDRDGEFETEDSLPIYSGDLSSIRAGGASGTLQGIERTVVRRVRFACRSYSMKKGRSP
jgi:hypothetical protein